MNWRRGLTAVLTMSLLACVVARAQQPLPWGPGTLPLNPPADPIAGAWPHASNKQAEAPLPLAGPQDTAADPKQPMSAAPVVLREPLPGAGSPGMPPSGLAAQPWAWEPTAVATESAPDPLELGDVEQAVGVAPPAEDGAGAAHRSADRAAHGIRPS